jgi:hypothetical protein
VNARGAENSRLITDSGGRVVHINRHARDWLGSESPLDYLSARIDKDGEGDDTLVRLRQRAGFSQKPSLIVQGQNQSVYLKGNLCRIRLHRQVTALFGLHDGPK